MTGIERQADGAERLMDSRRLAEPHGLVPRAGVGPEVGWRIGACSRRVALALVLLGGLGCGPDVVLQVPSQVDVGTLGQDEIPLVTLPLSNVSGESRSVAITTDCGCLLILKPRVEVASGESVSVPIQVRPGSRVGRYEKHVECRSRDEVVRTKVTFTVGGEIRVVPPVIDLGPFLMDSGAEKTVSILYEGEGLPPELSLISTAPLTTFRVGTLADGEPPRWPFVVQVHPGAPVGELRVAAELRVNGHLIVIPVRGTVCRFVAPDPGLIILGRAVRVGTVGTTTLRLATGFDPAVLTTRSSPNLEGKLLEVDGEVRLEVSVRSLTPGRFEGWTEILDQNQAPLTRVRVLGYTAAG